MSFAARLSCSFRLESVSRSSISAPRPLPLPRPCVQSHYRRLFLIHLLTQLHPSLAVLSQLLPDETARPSRCCTIAQQPQTNCDANSAFADANVCDQGSGSSCCCSFLRYAASLLPNEEAGVLKWDVCTSLRPFPSPALAAASSHYHRFMPW